MISLRKNDWTILRLARRLEREVKEILDDFSSDESLKASLLKGKRVQIAEELSTFFTSVSEPTCHTHTLSLYHLERVRQIQDKLEEFVEALNTEK